LSKRSLPRHTVDLEERLYEVYTIYVDLLSMIVQSASGAAPEGLGERRVIPQDTTPVL